MHFEFNGYRFDPDLGLSRGGRLVPLPPPAPDLLHRLLLASGRVVGAEGLARALPAGADASAAGVASAMQRLGESLAAAGSAGVLASEGANGEAGYCLTAPVTLHRATSPASAALAARRLAEARERAARRSPAELESAVAGAREALDIDPESASGWATLADLLVLQIARSLRPARQTGRLATQAAQRALTLDPDCTAALSVRGWVTAVVELEVERGLADLDRAVLIDPGYSGAHVLRAWALQAGEQVEQALMSVRRALAVHPQGRSVNGLPALYLLFCGRFEEALEVAREAAQRFADIDNAQAIAATAAALNGEYDEAVACGQRAFALAPHTPLLQAPLAYALARAGRSDESRRLLTLIEAQVLPLSGAATAPVHLALGDRSTAIARLEHSFEAGEPQFTWSRDDQRLAPLRREPALKALWARIGQGRQAA